ncbi:MAG: hypothetical protein ACR2N3_09035 [Pyrinomonadaceae bacterium]
MFNEMMRAGVLPPRRFSRFFTRSGWLLILGIPLRAIIGLIAIRLSFN